jgi:imidazolonepropionase-like amidohydrolase
MTHKIFFTNIENTDIRLLKKIYTLNNHFEFYLYSMKKIIFSFSVSFVMLCATKHLIAQDLAPVNGVHDNRSTRYAFIHANIVDANQQLKDATLIIKDDKIEAVGNNISIPKNATVIDLKGKYIYPSFIDLYSNYGIAAPFRSDKSPYEQMLSKKRGAYYWNQAIHPEVDAAQNFSRDANAAKTLRSVGFGTVLSHQQDGIARGSGCVVSLNDEPDSKIILKEKASAHYSFSKGISTQEYPNSLMGAIALLRQTYYDADWYKHSADKKEINLSLEAFNDLQNLPQIFEAEDKLNCLRAAKIANEFNVNYILKTNGNEYQRLNEITEQKNISGLIVPLTFPKVYDVSEPLDAMNISLTEMMHWEDAPFNLYFISKKNIPFAITYQGCKSSTEFFSNLRKTIKCGLDTASALKALTTVPAKMLNMENEIGTLQKGKIANFLICSSKIFDDKNIIYQNWVKGKNYILKDNGFKDIRGVYLLKDNEFGNAELIIKGTAASPEITINRLKLYNDKLKYLSKMDTIKSKCNFTINQNLITFSFNYPKDTSKATYRFSGVMNDSTWTGQAQKPDGSWDTWSAKFLHNIEEKKDSVKKLKIATVEIPKIKYPFNSYGNENLPTKNNHLIIHANVITNENDSVMHDYSVFIKNGKIESIFNKPIFNTQFSTDCDTINANGKFLSAGIIDEHSHIAINGGVNEGTQSVTSEVRIGDVVSSEDINIYRQLSGGVTAAHLLHGSANAIGGQSQLIKLRWGKSPEEMKFQNAPGFIKFALGENVKQANWGDNSITRFPQTRMGVEQVYMNAFTRAKEYEKSWQNWLTSKTNPLPRRDLELQALVEILHSKRFITCHSYQQGEINMLMHVADSFHFKVNTFTHILEGYKVADKMKAHGISGASTFSDWWAYKFEVMEAIPYNASLMTKVGLNVAVNSDDAEMGRRLNHEAAKSIKYGDLTEAQAMKLCTMNPAKMLHVDKYVGSIAVGKDADVVLWSAHPLSVYAVVEKTFVDGICYYDKQQDEQKREWIKTERARLIAKMLQAKKDGEASQAATKEPDSEYSCGHD